MLTAHSYDETPGYHNVLCALLLLNFKMLFNHMMLLTSFSNVAVFCVYVTVLCERLTPSNCHQVRLASWSSYSLPASLDSA